MKSPATDFSLGRIEFDKAGRFEESEHESHESESSRRSHGHDDEIRGHDDEGHGHHRFGDVVGAAVFAHRIQMLQRAEFRAEMHEIRHDIRDFMDGVEGGQLTAEQQSTFDVYVQDIIDLRESFDFKNWHQTDADMISARILDRFGIEAAPSEAAETTDPAAVDTLDAAVQDGAKTVTDPTPPAGGETTVTMEEIPPVVDTTTTEVVAAVEPEVTEPTAPSDTFTHEELTAMADRLAGVIADASAMMDDLLKALGA